MASKYQDDSRIGPERPRFGLRLLFVVVTMTGFLVFYLKEPDNLLCSPSLLAIVVGGVLCCAAIGDALFDSYLAAIASALIGGAIWLGLLAGLMWGGSDSSTFAIHCLVVVLTTAFLALSMYARTQPQRSPTKRYTLRLIALKKARASERNSPRTESEPPP